MVVFVLLIFLGNLFYFSHAKSPLSGREIEDFQNPDIFKSVQDANNLISNAPRVFTENRGQLQNDEVRFYDQGGSVWFTDDGMWIELRENVESSSHELGFRCQGDLFSMERSEQLEYKRVILKQEFVGANEVRPVGRERLSWNSNFFYGNDSSKWCTEVPNYREVYYEDLYDGIDLHYYIKESGLKSCWEIILDVK